jgi:hypothetical protein
VSEDNGSATREAVVVGVVIALSMVALIVVMINFPHP